MKTQILHVALALVALVGAFLWLAAARGQGNRGQNGGDQILDGIGETSLIARYILDGNAQDRSRDGHHATLHGGGAEGAKFVDDARFGRVLSLSGDDGVYMELPGGTLKGVESLSVTAWVYLSNIAQGQRIFDFQRGTEASFSCVPIATSVSRGVQAKITAGGSTGEQGPTGGEIETGQWVHVAVVLDGAARSLTIYKNGERAGQTDNLKVALDQVLDQKNPEANKLYIGSGRQGEKFLGGKLHDLRLYSVALTASQVAAIHRNASGSAQAAAGPAAESSPESTWLPTAPGGEKLVSVADIAVTTGAGQLPKLPVMLAGAYEKGAKGPDVRIIWPAPRNANDVQKPGTYILTGKVSGTTLSVKAQVTITQGAAAPAPRRTLEPFGLGQVVLNPDQQGRNTPFMKNRDKFVQTLAQTNPDNFLYMFRDAFGQPQPAGARALGGWDTQTTRLRGHASGHYLSALAQAYASSTYDPKLQQVFLQKMNYMIDTLYDLSQRSGKPKEPGGPANADPAKVPPGPGRSGYDSNLTAQGIRTDYWNWGTGFISAYPPDQFIMLEHGATYGGSNAQIWAPYYTLHKILAGLLDCYEVGGNKKALEIATGMGTWAYQRLKIVPVETRIAMWNRYIAGEYGGMNEVMARMYRLTGDRKFLDGAALFDNIAFFYGDTAHTGGLASNVDTLRGRHANQHIPQITGALETYRDSQDAIYFRIASNFWDFATNDYMYSIGGVAGAMSPNNAECFTAEPDTLWQNGFNPGGQNETCATYNMLKLSRQLFMFQPDKAKYMNYYEQALYNHILASVDEDDAGNTYHVPLNPGARKSFDNADMSGFTCCNGTALESNTKLQDSIYFRSADSSALYVNLYVPSTLTWTDRNTVVKQETNFPYADSTKLTIRGGENLEVLVRVPDWASKGFFVKVNGTDKPVDARPGSYVNLGNTWKDGDVIELKMPFDFHLFRVVDHPEVASIFYGPVLLASEEAAALQAYREVKLDMKQMSNSIVGDPSALRFKIGTVNFKPFYESYGRYSVYFDVKPE